MTSHPIRTLFTSFLLAATATAETPSAPAAFLPVPNPAQLRWHRAEYLMFAHFGMKTYYPSNDHLGDGNEDPKRFNPVKYDANQWVAAAKVGGFKGIVLTTKHHDGFCNWRTDTTNHSVKSSPWKNGEGDTVRELDPAAFGDFVSKIPEPLGIGKITLADGTQVPGFIAEPRAVHGAEEITSFGGWRAWLARTTG
jgi:hypothetical protein